ncbi:hypothetical protein CWE15_00290 [Aliidiomarina taiwanensis]|uniref:Murein transglycosylase n=1 Tax=Aliidiomarina taiwanensis TaxID=946228 RepID=A0A432X8M6_9GAMM|nr:transglycosylase SLT domain-containing protein [Aliidiomarina taiwanensis]RUO43676.1 hypothetical protein CWE15_00290 [Aliidiomarina taiwanensis]
MRKKIKQAFKNQCKILLALGVVGVLQLLASLPVAASLSLAEQRELFVQTEEHISARRFTEARENMAQLRGYALYPYLEAEFLQQNLSLANEPLISEFLNDYSGTPVADSLRTDWLRFLAQKNQAERFLLYYQGSRNGKLQCQYLHFLWQSTENLNVVWPQVSNQWVNGNSQPKECDPVFAAWANAGMRTEQHVWDRIKLALANKELGLVNYLTRLLPEQNRYLARLARRAANNSAAIMRFRDYQNNDPREQELILSALPRLIWQDIEKAEQAWVHYQQVYDFPDDVVHNMHERFGVTLSVRGDPEALYWLEQVPMTQLSKQGRQWMLAALLRTNRYDRVSMFINALPAEEQEKDQWRYWRARALLALNFTEEGQEELAEVAQNRSYYGFLASAHLNREASLAHQPVQYDTRELEALKSRASMQRAIELFALERNLQGRREWNRIAYRGQYQEQVLSAVLAHELGLYEQAIFTFAHTGMFNDVERRFPLAFYDVLKTHATSQNLDLAWVYAIVRRESSFRADAVSPVGARGLMQVMPGTAEYLLSRMPGPAARFSRQQLYNPEFNVRLGTRYLKELLQRSGNNWIVATAAYNAGIHRVQEWLPETPVELDVWVETVPYEETRNYIKGVLAYQQIYSMLLGERNNVFRPLISMTVGASHSG